MKIIPDFAADGSGGLRSRGLLLVCLFGLAVPAIGIDLPSPARVVREARGLIHRTANKVEGVARKAIPVEPRIDHEDKRSASSKKQVMTPPVSADDPGTFTPIEPSTTIVVPAPQSPVGERAPQFPEPLKQPAPLAVPKEVVPQREANIPRVPPSEPPAPSRREAPVVDATPLPEKSSEPSAQQPKPPAPQGGDIEIARAVPGKPGLVYAPGSKESSEDIIDVRGFDPGQSVRDPRTGKVFRVP